MSAFIRSASGVRLVIPGGGLLIGRGAGCGLIVDDPSVSRRQAIVLCGKSDRGGATVIPLGRTATKVNGEPITTATEVDDGAVLMIGDATFTIEVPEPPVPEEQVVEIGGQRFSVARSSMSVGGDPDADLHVPSWPPHAMSIWPVPGAIVVEFASDLDELGATQGDVRQLTAGEELSLGGVSMRVLVSRASTDETIENGERRRVATDSGRPTEALSPSRVKLEFLPNGGLLTVRLERELTAWLADKRCDLVAALLRPGGEFRPGEFVPDDVVVRLVWGTESANRAQLNTLIHRARKSLTLASLNGPAFIQRAPGGGATRFSLATGAEVTIL